MYVFDKDMLIRSVIGTTNKVANKTHLEMESSVLSLNCKRYKDPKTIYYKAHAHSSVKGWELILPDSYHHVLIDLVDLNLTRRYLRSDTQGKLPILGFNILQVCNSSIRYARPRLWNELPQNIRDVKTLGSFKILLKTYLFSKCYNC